MAKAHQQEHGGPETVVGVVTQDSLDPVPDQKLVAKKARVNRISEY